MANPTRLRWTHDLKWADENGADAGALTASDFVGFTLYIDDLPAVSVPVGWESDGQWEVPLKDFPAATQIGEHQLEISIRAKRTNGEVIESPRSEPVTYTWADERTVRRPFGLSVA